MGTNFYLHNTVLEEKIHLCKFSKGWRVLFQASEEIATMEDFFFFYFQNEEEYVIKNEYGEEYTLSEFLTKVKEHNTLFSKSHIGTGCGAYEADLGIEFTEFEFT